MVRALIFVILLISSKTTFANDGPVLICNDVGEWAPYFYFERTEEGKKTGRIVGATVDSLEAIFKKIGMEYRFELLPWKRCVAYVERYSKSKKYEMFSEAGTNSWRQQRFLSTSEPVYKRTNVFFYNKEKYPEGLGIKTVKDMEKYKVCVGAGLSYERYIKAGLSEEAVDVSHKSDYFDVIRKLSLGYCDIMPANLAVIEGGVRVKQFVLPDNITHSPDITIDDPFYYYYWIAKTSPRATQLRKEIDLAIRNLKDNGEWEKIYKKYLSNGSGLE